jgi:hypothetical protein
MNAGAHRTLVRRDCDNLKATLLFCVMFHHDNNVIRLKTAASFRGISCSNYQKREQMASHHERMS